MPKPPVSFLSLGGEFPRVDDEPWLLVALFEGLRATSVDDENPITSCGGVTLFFFGVELYVFPVVGPGVRGKRARVIWSVNYSGFLTVGFSEQTFQWCSGTMQYVGWLGKNGW